MVTSFTFMNIRIIKQILYGIFYLLVLAAVGFWIYVRFFAPTPSCFDHIQNQGEQGVDCGGPCAFSCVPSAKPLTSAGDVQSFVFAPGIATLLGQIANPNSYYGANIADYYFAFYDASSTLLGSVFGQTFIYPNETKYVIAPREAIPDGTVSMTMVIPTSTPWIPGTSMGSVEPALVFLNVEQQNISSGTAVLSGMVQNQGSLSLSRVTIVALLNDASGHRLGVSETAVTNVAVGGTVPFAVTYPADARIIASTTQFFGYAER